VPLGLHEHADEALSVSDLSLGRLVEDRAEAANALTSSYCAMSRRRFAATSRMMPG
jgi:hypothetical protein